MPETTFISRLIFVFAVALLIAGSGCQKKTETGPDASSRPPGAPDPVQGKHNEKTFGGGPGLPSRAPK